MQAKAEIVRARISPEIKFSAEQVLNSLGMSMSDAIRIFLNQVATRQEFPLELKVPNADTLAAMAEANEIATKSAARFNNFNELIDDLEKNSSQ